MQKQPVSKSYQPRLMLVNNVADQRVGQWELISAGPEMNLRHSDHCPSLYTAENRAWVKKIPISNYEQSQEWHLSKFAISTFASTTIDNIFYYPHLILPSVLGNSKDLYGQQKNRIPGTQQQALWFQLIPKSIARLAKVIPIRDGTWTSMHQSATHGCTSFCLSTGGEVVFHRVP